MAGKRKKGCLIAIISIFGVVFLSTLPLLMFVFDPFERPPMSQEQVERCFEANYESLAIVAAFLASIDHDGQIEIRSAERMAPTLHELIEARWQEMPDIAIEDPQVIWAINHLRRQGYSRMERVRGVIRFQRDSRSQFSRYGRFRAGVVYAMDGNDLSELFGRYSPLAVPNWFSYRGA
ncbi:MAG: hypothetical protein FWC72_02655 [Oscillospiraceae bacterium]|nr:hypothetical protein [Oscillospiraceae bacterium]